MLLWILSFLSLWTIVEKTCMKMQKFSFAFHVKKQQIVHLKRHEDE